MNELLALSVSDLAALKEALRTGRLPAPFLPALIERIVPRAVSGGVSAALQGIAAAGANHRGACGSARIAGRRARPTTVH
jgi:hypothetical protein